MVEGLRWLSQTALMSLPRPRPRPGHGCAVPLLTVGAIVGGCITTGSTAGFRAATAAAVGFGIAIAVLATSLAMLASARLHRVGYEVIMSASLALIAAWTVVATAWTLPTEAASWISFADGLGYIAIAIAILLRRGLSNDRAIHVLEVRELRTR